MVSVCLALLAMTVTDIPVDFKDVMMRLSISGGESSHPQFWKLSDLSSGICLSGIVSNDSHRYSC